jgi:hypothetical protein
MRPQWLFLVLLLAAGPALAKAKKPVAPAKAAKPAPAPAPVEVAIAEPPPAAPATPLTDEEFQGVMDALHDAGSSSSSRLSALQLAADGKGFRMDQVGRIVDLFSFSEDKIRVVKLLRPAIVDRANTAVLLAHFSFATDKDAVQKLVAE